MPDYRAKLVEFRDLAPEVRHFVFEIEGLERVVYVPGQFVSVTGHLRGQDVTRAYSIASPPDGNRIELCLNRVVDGIVSPHLFGLKPGDAVHLSEPLGYFVPRSPLRDSAFVATGTGIAPIRAMLKDLLAAGAPHEFTLLFGVRYQSGLLYREEFEKLAAEHANFHFWPTLSRPEESWRGRVGHVQDHLFEAIGPSGDVDAYVCGLKAMVDDVRARLKQSGFNRRRIIYEKYD